jgi:hypothetical protein
MRRVYALLGLIKHYGPARVDSACAMALEADMVDIYRLKKLLELAPLQGPSGPDRVIPLARYLRPAQQYALPLASHEPNEKGDEP